MVNFRKVQAQVETMRIISRVEQHCMLNSAQRRTLEHWATRLLLRKAQAPHIYALLIALCLSLRETSDLRPLRDNFRFAYRITRRFKSVSAVSATLEALAIVEPSLSLERLKKVWYEQLEMSKARQAATVFIERRVAEIRQFLEYVKKVTGYTGPIPNIQFVDKSRLPTWPADAEVIAYTNGRELFLSNIATTPYLDLNELWATLYLPPHEFLHIILGSFGVRLKSAGGSELLRHLRYRRNVLRRARQNDLSEDSSELWHQAERGLRLRKPGGLELISNLYSGSSTIWFHLVNALEDRRIERFLERNLPGLARLNAIHDSHYGRDVVPSPALSSSIANLLSAIGWYITGRVGATHVSKAHQHVYQQAQEIVDRWNALSDVDIYQTLITADRLMQVLEHAFESNEIEHLNDLADFKPAIPLEEILERIAEENHQAGSLGEIEALDTSAPGRYYPEVSDNGPIENAVRVIDEVFKVASSASVTATSKSSLNWNVQINQSMQTYGGRTWSEDGPLIAYEKIAQFVTSVGAGVQPPVITFHAQHRSPSIMVTILVDLSVSMTRKRTSCGMSSLDRTRQILESVLPRLQSRGIQYRLFTSLDSGRNPVSLQRIVGDGASVLTQLQPAGVSGFRMGAAIRHLARWHRTGADKHAILLFSDCAGGYFGASHAEEAIRNIRRTNCPACASKHRCTVEISDTNRRRISHGFVDAFYDHNHVFRDVADAIHGLNRGQLVHLFAINDELPVQHLKQHIHGYWSNASHDNGAIEGLSRLSRFCVSSRGASV